ncbi:MAG: CHAT domain-containing protein [Caldilineaceae bacterium]|nr:CHAT domain-containing protein [Caldilineaceae bacterium]HRJ44527.1 CHAT domain-containing protein [Caldilineaceae bacterium]
MAACQAENFDIAILGSQSPYTLLAEYQGLKGEGTFAHDALQPDWAEILQVLGQTHAPPGEPFILHVGGLLFDEILQGGIRDLWIEARSQLEKGHHLRMRLDLRAPAVAALPWEVLADPRRRRTLAADKSLALIRIATDADFIGRPRPIQTAAPASLLIVAVEEEEEIDAGAEIQRIQDSLASLIPDRLRVEILQGKVTLAKLRARLEQVRPDILHIISHGEADGLYLWNEDGLTLVKASQWAALLDLIDSVKLVFLNACLAGQPDNSIPYASLAQRLLQTGIPAVIAMQFVVRDRAAADFAGFLYDALIKGPCPGAIDIATSIARSGLYISDPDRIDYATPLLWLNSPDGMILHLTEQKTGAQPLTAPPETFDPPPLALEIEEKEAWFAQLPSTIQPIALRFDYAERLKQVTKVLAALRQDHNTQQAGKSLDTRRVIERLEIFNAERRFIDGLLERLGQAGQ